MSQASDFSYQPVADGAGLALTVSVFADRMALRQKLADDLVEAGFRLVRAGEVSELLEGELAPLGDAVLLDCPQLDAASMAALCRLDMRIARSGAQLIVSTTLDALDDVFACFDQSRPQILVDPGQAERIVAVGRILGHLSGQRLRELSADDRNALLQLTQQVEAIARQLEGLSNEARDNPQPKLADAGTAFRGFADPSQAQRRAQSGLPDPRLIREIIRHRQARARFFDAALFADPAWDMLLDLAAAHAERAQVSVSSLCIASGVPPTTALRWIRQMTDEGLFERIEDAEDRRRVFISLSASARDAMARYFAETGQRGLAYAA